ncbi:MAG: hypothetical protein WC959_10325 [Kiritimatiellales bacterium]
MIDVHQQKILNERRQWSGCVQRFLQYAEIEPRETAEAVIESLAVFCQGRTQIQGHELSLLTARAFCAAGDCASAGKILHGERTFRRHTNSWLRVLSARYPFPELFPLFAARALRPVRLTSAGVLWILDFSRMDFSGVDCHELILFQSLRQLTEKISMVWSKDTGAGMLGIKYISKIAGAVCEEQLLGYLRAVLNCCARKNNWHTVPEILQIDL